jgi:hypothetical protein
MQTIVMVMKLTALRTVIREQHSGRQSGLHWWQQGQAPSLDPRAEGPMGAGGGVVVGDIEVLGD